MTDREDKNNKKGSGRDTRYDNKDTSIKRSGERKSKYRSRERNDSMGRRTESRGRRGVEQDKRYEKEVKERQQEERIKGLRNRRKAVQEQMDIAKNSDNPAKDIDWGNKDLKTRDRRKLKEIIEGRNLEDTSSKDIAKEENKGLEERVKDNKKEVRKESAKQLGKLASIAGTGGLSAILAIPSLVMGSFRKRRLEKDTKKTKRQIYMRRFMFVLPTLLLMLGLVFTSFFLFMEVANITSIALSHPEGIKELHKAGVLGDALHMGNVTEDVTIINEETGEEEVLVKGNPEAQPGCFEWNGVWYCGGCLTTGGETQGAIASSNEGYFTQGSGETMGSMVIPINYPYKTTSDTGFRDLDGGAVPHGGMDLVPLNNIDILAADGGKVVTVVDSFAPDSGYYKHPGGWGNYVVIEHEAETYTKTLYGHLNYVDVKVGDVVSQGQKIGVMGHTGSSTGRHLHFEVWTGDTSSTRTEPRDYLNLAPEGVTWSKEGG